MTELSLLSIRNELERRAAFAGAHSWTYFQLLERSNPHSERKTSWGSMKFSIVRYRDLMRCGENVFKRGARISLGQRIAFLLAKMSVPFYKSYARPNEFQDFKILSKTDFIDFGESPALS
jgi:hypothetical protein